MTTTILFPSDQRNLCHQAYMHLLIGAAAARGEDPTRLSGPTHLFPRSKDTLYALLALHILPIHPCHPHQIHLPVQRSIPRRCAECLGGNPTPQSLNLTQTLHIIPKPRSLHLPRQRRLLQA